MEKIINSYESMFIVSLANGEEAAKATVNAQAQRLAELEKLEEEYAEKINKIMMVIPNIIDPSVPVGKDDSENVDVQRYGEPVVPEFDIPYHRKNMQA